MSKDVLAPLLALRQHQRDGQRSPHKPLLVLFALAQLAHTGSSRVAWSDAADKVADLIVTFGPPSKTSPTQTAAYPFTRLRSDGVWELDAEVPMDRVSPLTERQVTGRLTPQVEAALADVSVLHATARALVEAEFPPTLVEDVVNAVGLDPGTVLRGGPTGTATRRRSGAWPSTVLAAWDRQCAFCGFDGQLGNASVGIEAAHVRWFNFGGPDDLNNGLALCSLDHKLFDRGVLGLSPDYAIVVSDAFTARTDAGRRVYDLADKQLRPRRGTELPAAEHVGWHMRQVFKGTALAA